MTDLGKYVINTIYDAKRSSEPVVLWIIILHYMALWLMVYQGCALFARGSKFDIAFFNRIPAKMEGAR